MIKKIRAFFIRLIGNKKQRKFDLNKVNTILVWGGLVGDTISVTPMFRNIYEYNPNIKINVICDKNVASLLEHAPYINRVLVQKNLKKYPKILRILFELVLSYKHRGDFDLLITPGDNIRFLYLLQLRLLGAKYLVGNLRMEKWGIKKDELTLFDRYSEAESGLHAVDQNLAFLKAIDIPVKHDEYELYLGDLETKYSNYFSSEYVNVLFNFKGSSECKSLNFEEIKFFLSDIPKINVKIKVHILTMPSDRKKIKNLLYQEGYKHVELLPETLNVLEAVAITKYVDFVFSVDTGIVHIACVYNKPVVAIYSKDLGVLSLFSPRTSYYEIIKGTAEGVCIYGFDKAETLQKIEKCFNYIEDNNLTGQTELLKSHG